MRISDWSSDVCSSDLLKVIITSATIDAERFARHFAASEDQLAPVIEVSGRLYPVELRYRPVREDARSEERRVGTAGSVRVDLGGRSSIKKKTTIYNRTTLKTNLIITITVLEGT